MRELTLSLSAVRVAAAWRGHATCPRLPKPSPLMGLCRDPAKNRK
jgi:hypothetical protein